MANIVHLSALCGKCKEISVLCAGKAVSSKTVKTAKDPVIYTATKQKRIRFSLWYGKLEFEIEKFQ